MRYSALLVNLAVMLSFAAPAGAEPGVSDKEVRFFSCSTYSGPIKGVGEDEIAGAKAYLDYVNREQGGVYGRRISIETFDDEYDPAKAVACFNQHAPEDVLAGAFFGGAKTATKYVEMAKARKLPIIGIATGADFLFKPVNRYVLSVRGTYSDEMDQQIDHLWNDLGLRKYGAVYQNDALGGGGLKGVQDALAKHGAQAVAIGSFPTNSKEVEEAVAPVRAAKPEVVFALGGYASTAEVAKRVRASKGWNPLLVILPGRDEYIKLAGEAAEGSVYAIFFPPPDDTRLTGVALFNRLMKKYSAKPADIKTEEGFVHAMILVEGLKRAGKNLTREGLIDAIETMKDVDLGFGPGYSVSFSPENHQGFKKVLFTVVRKGKSTPFTDWKTVAP